MLKKLLPTAFAVTALAASVSAQAKSISGSVDFRVTLPEVLVLYHWDDAHLTLTDNVADTPNDSDQDREISDATTKEGTGELNLAEHTITGDVARPDIPFARGDKIKVTLKNSWAVRALSIDDVTLGLAVQQEKLKSVIANSSEITVSDAKLKATNATGAKEGTSLKLPSQWSETMGDIEFNLDLQKAKHTGEYNTRGVAGSATVNDEATDTFLLTLTGN
ncbi:hypothetical protein [Actinobacillus genomosp. 1]|uniref:hypothetical protein n=1 Tax=Actinobacillus genomosp. 1 TaxID=254839 RepID=UPI0024416D00|nr:hypothetical protein [Actinobacillus genomosp. 1]WGE90474.1 hypothetical protein NYR63_06395 [Actinobacillus genomosp. 1]